MPRKPASLATRIAAVSSLKDAALATFEKAAASLEAAAAEHLALSNEAQAEVARLVSLAKTAEADAAHALRAASKVRDLTS